MKQHYTNILLPFKYLFVVCLWCCSTGLIAQELQSATDKTEIEIGEEVKLIINVTVDTTSTVVFPETKMMGNMEVINSYKPDTTFNNAKMKLIKQYGLTQFDSGNYSIPRLKILIDGKSFETDSTQVAVKDVLVDTTKQKMYDIKPIIQVEKPKESYLNIILYILIGLVLLGALLYLLFFRKTKKEREAENKLPPYEAAILHLKELENSNLLENEEFKTYYSQLTDVLKNYLEEDVYDNALENTSDEILTRLELLRTSGELPIATETIQALTSVLRTADLVKFAKSKPDTQTAKLDRTTIFNVIQKTKEALPEPTEEELLQDEAYRLAQAKKKRNRKILYASLTGFGVILIALAVVVVKYGFNEVKDNIIGHPTKELLEGDWIKSEYGNPAIVVATPKVLKRLPIQNTNAQEEHFGYGSLLNDFYVKVSIVKIPETVRIATQEEKDNASEEDRVPKIDLEQVNELTLQSIEKMGAKDLLVKHEVYETLNGFEGMKAFGSFNIETASGKSLVKSNYEIITFSQDGAIQQVIVVSKEGDTYAKDIVKRILDSVELKKLAE